MYLTSLLLNLGNIMCYSVAVAIFMYAVSWCMLYLHADVYVDIYGELSVSCIWEGGNYQGLKLLNLGVFTF